MMLHMSQLKLFQEFLKTQFGGELTIHDDEKQKRSGEYARGMVVSNFLHLRSVAAMSVDASKEKVLEVCCSNGEWLNELEKTWDLFMVALSNETAQETSE